MRLQWLWPFPCNLFITQPARRQLFGASLSGTCCLQALRFGVNRLPLVGGKPAAQVPQGKALMSGC
jgi:hypothetical protein